MKKDKIIIHAITRCDVGGAQKHLYLLIKGLGKQNKNVQQILITGKNGKWLKKFQYIDYLNIMINPFLIRSPNPIFDFFAFIYGIFQINLLKNRNSNIILHSNAPKAGIIYRLIGFFTGIKQNYFTIHGWDFYEGQNKILKFFIIIIEKLLSYITYKFISVCKSNIDIAANYGINIINKTKIIYGGFDYNYYAKIKKNKKQKRECKRIGIITNFKKPKKTDVFINIARELIKENNNIKFVIIGDGKNRTKVEQLINKYRLNNLFEFKGYMEKPEKELINIDILVSTSIWEGLPRSLIQAYLLNIPFVAYNTGGIYEFAKIINNTDNIVNEYNLMIDKIKNIIKGNLPDYNKSNIFNLECFLIKHCKLWNI